MLNWAKEKSLILSPHPDDACLGMGGFIELMVYNPNISIVVYTDHKHPGLNKDGQAKYSTECFDFIEAIQCLYVEHMHKKTNHLESENIEDQIKDLESTINAIKPYNIFVPHKDYNQDHRRVYDIASVATRSHDKNWFVPNVFTYEQVCTVQSQTTYEKFNPHVFVPINIDRKLKLWDIFKTQHRGHRTHDMIKALAAVRGMQCQEPYAEAFQVIRMTA